MLPRSNSDSSDSSGFDAIHPGWSGGWVHEVKVVTWRMPGGGFETDTVPVDASNACGVDWHLPPPPVSGATLFAMGHSHPLKAGDRQYCNRSVSRNGHNVPGAARPGDGRPFDYEPPDSADADRPDRNAANDFNVPSYVITHGGVVLRINPAPAGYPNLWNFYRVFGGSEAERKCAWVKKYQ
jgi:hypothetical protein